MTFQTCYLIIFVVYFYLLYNCDLLYLFFAPYIKLLILFQFNQTILFKKMFFSLDQNQANIEKSCIKIYQGKPLIKLSK